MKKVSLFVFFRAAQLELHKAKKDFDEFPMGILRFWNFVHPGIIRSINKQVRNGPSQRPVQGSTRAKFFIYAEEHKCESFIKLAAPKMHEGIPTIL